MAVDQDQVSLFVGPDHPKAIGNAEERGPHP
jgi:hypothetical protein